MNSKHQKTDLRPSLLFTALAIAGLVSPLPAMAALKPLVSVSRLGHVTAHASTVRRPVTKAARPAAMKTQAANGILVHMRNNTRLTPAVLASFERATATRLAVTGNPGNGQYVLHPASATSPAKLAAATTKLRKNPNVLAANLYVKDKPRLIQALHGQKVALAANSVPSGHSHVWQQSLGVPVQLNGTGSPNANFQRPRT